MPSAAQVLHQLDERHGRLRLVDDEDLVEAHVDLVGPDAELPGGARDEPGAQPLCRLLGGIAGHVERARRRGRAGERGHRRIAVVDDDVVEGDAEHLHRDLAQRRDLAGADVGDAGAHHHGAVHLDPHPGLRGVVQEGEAAVALLIAGETAADPYRPVAVGCGGFAQRRPGLLRALLGPDGARRHEAGGHGLAGLEEIPPPQLQAVETERPRDLVHLLLVGRAGLQRAEAAKRAGVHVVGRDRAGEDVEVVDAVGAGCGDQRVEDDVGAEEDVGAGVGGHPHIDAP